jgi:RING finger protein 170
MQDVTFECLLSTLTRYGFFLKNKLLQRVRDMPLLLRRMIWELMDPQRAIPLVHRTRILFFLVLLAIYVFSPLDVIPEGVVGLVGLLDDVLVIVMVLFYLAMLYRSTLILHHGGHQQ